MLGWSSGQCKVKMAVLSQFTYYWTESHMIRWKAEMEIHSNSHSSIPIPILLFLLPFPFPWYNHCQWHSHGNPMEPMGSQLFPFPCTSLIQSVSRVPTSLWFGQGSGPSTGRVGLGHKILSLGWVGLGRVQCQKYPINMQFKRRP